MALTRTISPAILPHLGGILSFESTYDHRRISIGSEHECDPFPNSPTFSPQHFVERDPIMPIDDELDLCSSRFEPATEMTYDDPTKVNCFDNSSTVSTMCPMSP